MGPRGDLLVGLVSTWCEDRAAEKASGLRIGPGARGKEGGLGVEKGISCGCCECLVRGEGSREGMLDANRAKGIEVGRVVLGPRGDLLMGSVSAWYNGQGSREGEWVANRARGKRQGGWSWG